MILKAPHEALHTLCEAVTFAEGRKVGKELKIEYIKAVQEAKNHIVVGLAAPQIGIQKRVFVMRGHVCINPSIVRREATTTSTEGCLSLPLDKSYQLERNSRVLASWTDTSRNRQTRWLEGPDAIVFQHELDHLEGRLCDGQ